MVDKHTPLLQTSPLLQELSALCREAMSDPEASKEAVRAANNLASFLTGGGSGTDEEAS